MNRFTRKKLRELALHRLFPLGRSVSAEVEALLRTAARTRLRKTRSARRQATSC